MELLRGFDHMTADADRQHSDTWTLLRLRVTTDGDPSVLPRLLGLFQNLNVTPRQVTAEFDIQAAMHVSIDVSGVPPERLSLIAAKIGQTPCVLNAYWHYL
jgi:hypothetical protein